MDFEWDPGKNAVNVGKHGVDFEDACRIFEGPVLERVDDRRDYGETRVAALGEVERRALFIPGATKGGGLFRHGGPIPMSEKRTARRSPPTKRQGRRARRTKTDRARVDGLDETGIDAAARGDADAQPTDAAFWTDAALVMPESKVPLSLRLDRDVIDWFRAQGRGYQTRINAVLRAYMNARGKTG